MDPSSSRPQRNRRPPERLDPTPSSSSRPTRHHRRPLLPPRPPRQQTPPPSYPSSIPSSSPPPPLNSQGGEKRWVLDSPSDSSKRVRKRKYPEEESILETNHVRTLNDHELREFFLNFMKYRAFTGLQKVIDSTSEIQKCKLLQDHQVPLMDDKWKWDDESNEINWKDYTWFLTSLKQDFPFVSIHNLISSLNVFKKSMLDFLERNSEKEFIQKIEEKFMDVLEERGEMVFKDQVKKRCDMTKEQEDIFVQSLMASPTDSDSDSGEG